MRLLPGRGPARAGVIFLYALVLAVLLVIVFEFVVNPLLPANY